MNVFDLQSIKIVPKHLGRSPSEATRLRFGEKNHFAVAYWSNLQSVMELLLPAQPRGVRSCARWWEKRHYGLKVRPVSDCKMVVSWSNRSRVSAMGERPNSYELCTAAGAIINSVTVFSTTFSLLSLLHCYRLASKTVSNLTWNMLRQHTAAAASELQGIVLVTTQNVAVACR
jgi:hypothetical protein